MLTFDKNDPLLNKVKDNGQQEAYVVLSDEERAKGFIRPVRDSYVHRGRKIEKFGTIESLEQHANDYYTKENGYAAFLKYPESEFPLVGRYIKQDELDAFNNHKQYLGGCGTLTKMHIGIAETYARDPKFYGATFCVGCGKHLPVNEFVWDGTNEEVGS